ncbi:electron transfer flavo protein subunit beta [Eremomyces bilateralis CBS 781.70]|uniref:Probable electron transfer flavoprotein subunit beta n=1 Tax=Eremomyces bilateralis CBS 781.70 TaxID=1392243 RepID=A0A6G1G331_9PEZI|nr:electron transfer flavo protein subunit beta [Eremomyces bilateralis CBS 781.70]KAF1812453.1 electron transfer flavo protein subunit beta [Eremomyces bilateralis CBS 781.70]
MSGLRVLVPIKRVIDYAVKPRINKSHTGVETAGVKHSMNPFDELSIEEAVRLRERAAKSPTTSPRIADILAFTAGPPKAADALRTALAMGADRGIHVTVADDAPPLEPLGVAKLLAQVAREEKADLVILGKQAIDGDMGQTGQMVAGLLGWGQATQAAQETLKGKLPMVITTDLRLNEPRYASLPNIMKAKKKPVVKRSLEEMGVDVERRLKTVSVEEPPAREGGVKVENVDGMIAKLKELGAL